MARCVVHDAAATGQRPEIDPVAAPRSPRFQLRVDGGQCDGTTTPNHATRSFRIRGVCEWA
jgi:hypothetical protein